MNVLITSCSRDVTLVKAFRSALINNGGGKVFCADIDPLAPALYFADEYRIIPRSDNEEFIPYLLNLCKEENIKLIISSRDGELPVLADAKSRFKDTGTRVMVADKDTLSICRNKLLFCRFCQEHHIPIPETYFKEEEIKFPAFIKPIVGAGSLKIHKVANSREYRFLKEIYKEEFVIQEYITWPEFTVDLFADFDGKILSIIPRERIRTVGGESYIGRTIKNNNIIDQSLHLAQQLKLIGHNTLQCFAHDKDVKFIEVNPRFGGGANLGFNSGLNSPELLIKLLKGEKIEPAIGKFKDNLIMLRYTQDIFLEPDRDSTGKSVLTNKLADIRSNETNQIYCIDVDGTICTEKVEYEKAKPIEKTVNKINQLYDNGNTIILYTARGAYSGVDWSELTKKQLKAWGVKYHQFLIGKPFAHWYVDNKALHILDWI